MPTQEVLRAYRFALDPTSGQLADLARHAGSARWAYNHAIAAKRAAHEQWRTQVTAIVDTGVDEAEAKKRVKVPIPGKVTIQKALNQAKGDSRSDTDGLCPWWHEVSTYAFQSAMVDADAAWQNWIDSYRGVRAGRRVGYPQFKRKGRARDAFRLHHDVRKPTIRMDGYRRLLMPRIGSVRLHESGKALARLVERGDAVVQSVTVSRGAHRWYACVLAKVQQDIPERPTRRQRERGRVGVEWGVRTLVTLSNGESFANPRHLAAAQTKIAKAQRAFARTQKGSARRVKAAARVARLHHQVAQRRATSLHTVTKVLATGYAGLAVRELAVQSMTRSASGTVAKPGRNVRVKATFNRVILDAAPAELRRQLGYKTHWYGSALALAARDLPSSQTCSNCGWRDPSFPLHAQVFVCGNTGCRTSLDRELNAARNIRNHAVDVARDRQETVNARGAGVRPGALRDSGHTASKREDQPQRATVAAGHPGGAIPRHPAIPQDATGRASPQAS